MLPSDWYGITKASFYANHGAGLLRSHYDDSPQRAVREILPEMDWKPWLFTSVPQRFWHEVGNRLDYLKWLGQQLSLRNPDDWLRLSSQQLRQHCGASLLEFYESGAARLDSTNAVACTQHKAKAWSLIVRVECTLNGHDPQTLFTALA